MTTLGEARAAPVNPPPVSRWPLLAAPFAGLLYYLVLLAAFRHAIGDVVADTSDLSNLKGLTWGNHWIYHAFAEIISIVFATFVAGGLGRDSAATAGLIGGFGISLWWSAWIGILLFVLAQDHTTPVGQPLYELLISGAAGVAAPIIGYWMGETTRAISTEKPTGFAGVPRAHFIWLWMPAYFYAIAMIGPVLKYILAYFLGYDGNTIIALDTSVSTGIIYFVLCVVPLMVSASPLFIGLGLLSGNIGNPAHGSKRMHPALRQALGITVLIIGWFIAAGVHYVINLLVFGLINLLR